MMFGNNEAVNRLVPCPSCVDQSRQQSLSVLELDFLHVVAADCYLFNMKDLTVAAIVEKKNEVQCQK